MAKRKVIVAPHHNFDFKTNSEYESEWDFLKDDNRKKIIAAQLTYLEFHAWLHSNLRTELYATSPKEELFGDVAEGFIRTDVLLFGAICESALFDMVEWEFKRKDTEAIKEVQDCFRTFDFKKLPVNDSEFTMDSKGSTTTGKLALIWERENRDNDSNATFEKLIKAGLKMKAYDNSFRTRLDNVRKDRNTIHLSEQLKRKQKDKYRFDLDDRRRVKEVTEELRKKIKDWYSANN